MAMVLVPDRDEVGGLERLKEMDYDKIDDLLSRAMTELQVTGCFQMANVLYDIVYPIMEAREPPGHRNFPHDM